jgi:hypothetical protein
MNILTNPEYRHLLYKDEINDLFLLTRHMEIYKKSDSLLGCICWSPKTMVKLRSKGIVLNELITSDKLYCFDVMTGNLPILIECGTPKRRIHRNGRKLHHLEKRLAHKILPTVRKGISE